MSKVIGKSWVGLFVVANREVCQIVDSSREDVSVGPVFSLQPVRANLEGFVNACIPSQIKSILVPNPFVKIKFRDMLIPEDQVVRRDNIFVVVGFHYSNVGGKRTITHFHLMNLMTGKREETLAVADDYIVLLPYKPDKREKREGASEYDWILIWKDE